MQCAEIGPHFKGPLMWRAPWYFEFGSKQSRPAFIESSGSAAYIEFKRLSSEMDDGTSLGTCVIDTKA